MYMKRVIPCLDVKGGRVVKGIRFQGLRDAGDPVALADAYRRSGADELVVLDVSATVEERSHGLATIRALREVLDIPMTVGGGVRSVEDASALLEAGADKVAVNTAAVRRPALLRELADRFGRQCVVLSLDAARRPGGWQVVVRAGQEPTGTCALAWASRAVGLGAGEILLTSWDQDGTGGGYDLPLLRAVTDAVPVPVVASGGAEGPEDLARAFAAGASAALAASMFHDGRWTLPQVKAALKGAGVQVRS